MLKKSVLIIFALLLTACDREPQQETALQQVYPWQVDVLADGSTRVFGLQPGTSVLADAGKRFNTTPEIALFDKQGQLSLEAYFSQVTLGGLSGRMVMILDVSHEKLMQLKQNVVKSQPTDSGSIKHSLKGEDIRDTYNYRVRSIDYIPYVNLDDETIRKRFGEPQQVIKRNEHLSHYLYPDRGLDLIQDEEGKEVLQYVEPTRFNELLQPLLNAGDQNK